MSSGTGARVPRAACRVPHVQRVRPAPLLCPRPPTPATPTHPAERGHQTAAFACVCAHPAGLSCVCAHPAPLMPATRAQDALGGQGQVRKSQQRVHHPAAATVPAFTHPHRCTLCLHASAHGVLARVRTCSYLCMCAMCKYGHVRIHGMCICMACVYMRCVCIYEMCMRYVYMRRVWIYEMCIYENRIYEICIHEICIYDMRLRALVHRA